MPKSQYGVTVKSHVGGQSLLLDRIAHGRLAGRARELSGALACLNRAIEGQGQFLLLTGEPGVGKTRLTREVMARAQSLGATALVGDCYPEVGGPYAPIAQIIRDSFSLPQWGAINLPEPILADLLTLVRGERTPRPSTSQHIALDPNIEQHRMFDSVLVLCEALSGQAPLVLLLEDVQWADTASLLLMQHLARHARHLHLLVILTCRDPEAEQEPLLARVLLELNRERLATAMKLHRLNRDETREMLAFLFQEEIAPNWVDSIYSQTEGNPFFVEEVCRALIDEGDLFLAEGRWHRTDTARVKIPQTVRAAIRARTTNLSQATQEVLLVAAILGNDFDLETLRRVCEMEEDPLIDALEELTSAQLIAEDRSSHSPPIRFRFVHALVPIALHESVIHLRRQRLHRRAAAAIESLRPDDYEALAYHLSEAGDDERAREYNVKAGDRARTMAPGDAVRFYRAALERRAAADLAGSADVLSRLGYCLWVTDDVQGALEIFEEAFTLFMRLDDRVAGGEMQRMIGRMYWQQSNREAASQHFRRALEILEPGPETVELARAMSSISQMHLFAPVEDKAIAWAEKALALAERLGVQDVIVDSLDNIGCGHAQTGDFEVGIPLLRQSVQRGMDAGLPVDACRAFYNYGVMLHRQCRYREAIDQMKQLRAYADSFHLQGYTNLALLRLALGHWVTGDWGAALGYRHQIGEDKAIRFSTWQKRVYGQMDLELGRGEDSRRELEASLPSALLANDLQTTVPHLGQLALAYAAETQVTLATETFRKMLGFVSRTAYVCAESVMPLLYACQWLTQQGAPAMLDDARVCLSHLRTHASRYRTEEAEAALAEGQACVSLAERDAVGACEGFRRAASVWTSVERPYDQARALSSLGRAYVIAGDPPAAHDALTLSLGILDSLSVQLDEGPKSSFLRSPLVSETRGLIQRPGLSRSSRRNTKRPQGELTEREQQVAALVAAGNSNHAIAQELVLSERTVENHIANILSKLRLTSRTQIAVWAVEKGLVRRRP